MAGASMKDIKLRIKSVESTMQITKAMELVASSKLRKAKERQERSRPYFMGLKETLVDIESNTRDFSSPYQKQREVKKRCLIMIAGDRGLAGGYNSNVLKLTYGQMEGKEVTVLPIGKKSVDFCRSRKLPVMTESYAEAEDISVSDCFTIAKSLCKQYLAGQIDDNATLTNVKIIASKLQIDSNCAFLSEDYSIGLICGSGNECGIDASGITCIAVGDAPETVEIIQEGTSIRVGKVSE